MLNCNLPFSSHRKYGDDFFLLLLMLISEFLFFAGFLAKEEVQLCRDLIKALRSSMRSVIK